MLLQTIRLCKKQSHLIQKNLKTPVAKKRVSFRTTILLQKDAISALRETKNNKNNIVKIGGAMEKEDKTKMRSCVQSTNKWTLSLNRNFNAIEKWQNTSGQILFDVCIRFNHRKRNQ